METAESETAGAEAGPLPHAPGPSEEVPETEGTEGGETSHEWYYQEPTTGQPAGPWTVAQLRARWQRDEINGLTPVWHVGLESWIPIAEMSELKDALRQAVADVADVEERPAKRRRTLDEVPLIHTYTNEQGQLYVYDTVDEDWKASDIYEALLEEPSGDVPERPDREAPTVTVDGEGMTPEEQDAAMHELFEEANRGGPLGAGPTMDPRRQVASDLAVERAHGEVAAQVAKAKAAKAAKAGKVTEASEPKVEQEEVAAQEKAKPRKTKANRFKEAMEADEEPKEGEPKGVVYLGHIPDGFFEQQIKKYFSQFGDVTRFKLARSRKTGGSKGYAFIEFRQESVAKIVAQTMNKYILGNKTLVCTFKPREECHPKLFSGWREEISDPRPVKRAKHMLGFNDRPSVEVDGQAVPQMTKEQVKRRDLQKKKMKAKLKQLEVDYDIDEVLEGAADDEAEEEEPEVKHTKLPKKKKRRAASST